MRMRPRLTDSRPAIIRRVVLLPQPDGPTRTRNSPSAMVRSRAWTAVWPLGYTFSTWSSRIAAIGSPLHGPRRQPGDDAALEDQHQQGHGRGRHGGRRQDLAPGHLVLAAEQ